jgi:predicted AAA+ superfamily ATPase
MSQKWMGNFISTYLNRDLLMLGLNASPLTIRKLWTMLAHRNGQIFHVADLAKSLGVTAPTVKRYVDFLEEAFLLKTLHPFFSNIQKRLVKSPKVFITDTGILHYLTGIDNFDQLSGNPVIGNSWEAFVLNQITSLKADNLEVFFYRTHNGAEADLVFLKGVTVVAAAEIKYSNSPLLSKGNYLAFEDLSAKSNFVITPSSDDFLFKENIRICSLKTFLTKYLPKF